MPRALLLLLLAIAPSRAEEFSHKKHAAFKLECVYCHTSAVKAERAGFPAPSQCMLCHATLRRKSALLEKTFVTRYHKVPDFVNFSHATHKETGCAGCHGAIQETESAKPHMIWKMKTCVDCHKTAKAKVTCDVCHELGQ